MIIELNIFTNSSANSPSTMHIENTYASYLKTFGYGLKNTVWCDVNPNTKSSDEYIINLKKTFNNINPTGSLIQGYHTAIKNSNSEFMFMLEHDWDFKSENINHTLLQIMEGMRKDNILHLRFNKRTNQDAQGWDLNLVEIKGSVFDFCMTDCVSNNPHIINRQRWLDEASKYIDTRCNGAYGLEEFLTRSPIRGAIYGALGHPPSIHHTDGKHLTRQY
jgi:hypothetical protein